MFRVVISISVPVPPPGRLIDYFIPRVFNRPRKYLFDSRVSYKVKKNNNNNSNTFILRFLIYNETITNNFYGNECGDGIRAGVDYRANNGRTFFANPLWRIFISIPPWLGTWPKRAPRTKHSYKKIIKRFFFLFSIRNVYIRQSRTIL